MILFKSLTLTVRFLLELCMLAALASWGFQTHWLLGLGAPLAAAVVWGLLIAPKATVKVPRAVWVGLQVVLFGLAGLALAAAGAGGLAVAFLVVVVLDGAAMLALGL
jgi:hypothetical protein